MQKSLRIPGRENNLTEREAEYSKASWLKEEDRLSVTKIGETY